MSSKPVTGRPVGGLGAVGSSGLVASSQQLHEGDDVDRDALAHHHTLGFKSGQAAPGDHKMFSDTGWQNVTFSPGWQSYGSPDQVVQQRKVGDFVYIRGLAVCPGGNGSANWIFQCPWAPISNLYFMAGAAVIYGIGRLEVLYNGIVTTQYMTIGAGGHVALDGIYWSTT